MTLQSCKYTWQAFKVACRTFIHLLGGEGFIVARYIISDVEHKSCSLETGASLYGFLPKSVADDIIEHMNKLKEKYE